MTLCVPQPLAKVKVAVRPQRKRSVLPMFERATQGSVWRFCRLMRYHAGPKK
jgi:hypothetical protein